MTPPSVKARRLLRLIIAASLVAAVPLAASAQAGPANAWREDVTIMAGLLTTLHANPFHTTSKAAFAAETARLHADIPDLADSEIIVRMARLAASIGDAHTRLNIAPGRPGVPGHPSAGFVRLPLRLEWFSDGLFIRAAATDLAELIGTRVIRIGNLPVDAAIERILPVIHHDNPMTQRLLLPGFVTMPAVLHATGVIDSLGSVPMVFEDASGGRVVRALEPSTDADLEAVDVLSLAGLEPPRWLDSRGRPYWFERLPDSRAVYVQLNASRPSEKEPMTAFVQRLRRVLGADDVERAILDLRRNGGGDSELTRPLLALLAGWEAAHPDRALFVLIGRTTFSAGVVLAAELERYTGAVFVGEPTGGRPHQYGEIETFTLPHSGLTVSHASWFFQTSDPWDGREWVPPDLFVAPTFGEFARGRDPVLERALSHDFRAPTLAAALIRTAREADAVAALAAYDAFRAQPEHRYAYTEPALTGLVIDLWLRNHVAASLPVALRVTEEYPASFEARENVAEIHAALGDTAKAVTFALESLRLHPNNGDALNVLRNVCGPGVLRTFTAIDPASEAGREALREACPQ